MQKRLISENVLQMPNQSMPTFSSYASFIAYPTNTSIRIKTFSKDVRQYDLKVVAPQANTPNNAKQDPIKRYYFCAHKSSLILVIELLQKIIEMHEVEVIGNEIKCRIRGRIEGGEGSVGIPNGVAYIYEGKTVKAHNFETNNSTSICECTPLSKLLQHEGEQIFLLSPSPPSTQPQATSTIRMFSLDPLSANHYTECALSLNYPLQPVSIYKDRYIFNHVAATKQIEIINMYESVIVGKFEYQGEFVHAVIRNGVLLLVTGKQNMDRYYFYTLKANLYNGSNGQADTLQHRAVFSHRSVYEKGKGTGYEMFCTGQQYADFVVQGKVSAKDLEKVNSRYNNNIIGDQILLIYVQPAKKNKLEVLKVSASKIREEAFKQKESNTIILSKEDLKEKGLSQKKLKADKQLLEIEKARLGASMNHRKSEKSIQEMQKKIIDHVVDIKIRGLMEKFEQLQKRLISIEDQIAIIYKKIQKSIENINREEIRRNVQGLFERVTPQFESYFKQVFRQISGVLDQGMNYYTTKLAKESEIHRDAFNQIINMTFDAAQEIAEIGRKELKHSEKTSEDIQKLLQIRKKWESQANQLSQAFKPKPAVDEVNVGINLSLQSPNNLSPDKKTSPQGKNRKN